MDTTRETSRADPMRDRGPWAPRHEEEPVHREPCTWAECGLPAVALTSTSGLEDVWVCEDHLDEAIWRDPDRDVWRLHEPDEAVG